MSSFGIIYQKKGVAHVPYHRLNVNEREEISLGIVQGLKPISSA